MRGGWTRSCWSGRSGSEVSSRLLKISWLAEYIQLTACLLLEGIFDEYSEKGGYCHEGNSEPPAQKPIEQRDNHRPGCWDTNLATIR